jgi:hypothetical protein
VAHSVDALEKAQRHAVDVNNRQEGLRHSLPDKAFRPVEVGLSGWKRGETLERPRDPLDKSPDRFLEIHGRFVPRSIRPRCKDEAGRYSRGTFRGPPAYRTQAKTSKA